MLARQYFREHAWIAAGYFVLLQVALLAAVLYWPDFRDNLPAILKIVPAQVLRDLLESVQEGSYWGYFSLQQFFKGCSLFGGAAAAVIGSGLVARDADQGTVEFLLSRPVTRRRILLARWSVGALLVTVPVFASSLGGIAASRLVDERVALGSTLLASAYLSLFLLALFTLTVWMSASFQHQLRAGTLLVALLLLEFAVYLVKVLHDFSLFALVDLDELMPMEDGRFPWLQAAALSGATAAFLWLALRRFERRDF